MARRKLLVIDDELMLLMTLVRLAREHGYDATGTSDPTEAMSRVVAIRPDIVLLDLRMPRVDGRDLLARILADPDPPAVVVMTGWLDDHTEALCRRYGAADVVRKPFDLDDLFRRLAKAICTAKVGV